LWRVIDAGFGALPLVFCGAVDIDVFFAVEVAVEVIVALTLDVFFGPDFNPGHCLGHCP